MKKWVVLAVLGIVLLANVVCAFTPPGLEKAKFIVKKFTDKTEVHDMLNTSFVSIEKQVIGNVSDRLLLPGIYSTLIVKVSGLGNKTQYITNGSVQIANISPINGSWLYGEDYSIDTHNYISMTDGIQINTTGGRVEVSSDTTFGTDTLVYNFTVVNGNFSVLTLKNTSFYVAPNTTAGSTEDDFNIYISTDNGSSWTLVVDGADGSTSEGTQYTGDVDLSSYVNGRSSFLLKLEFINDGADDNADQPDIWFDNLVLEGTVDKYPSDGKVYIHSITVGNVTKLINKLVGYGDTIEVNLTNIKKFGHFTISITVSEHTNQSNYKYTVYSDIFKYEAVSGSFIVDPSHGVQVIDESPNVEPIPLFIRPETHACICNVSYINVNTSDFNSTLLEMKVSSEKNNVVHFVVADIDPQITEVALYIDGKLVDVIPVHDQTVYFNYSNWSEHTITLKVYDTAFIIGPAPVTWHDITAVILSILFVLLIVALVMMCYGVYRGRWR